MTDNITDEEVQRILERLSEPTAEGARHDVCECLLSTLESTGRVVACLDAIARRCGTLQTIEAGRHLRQGSGVYRLGKVQVVLEALAWALHDADASSTTNTLNHAALDKLWEPATRVLKARDEAIKSGGAR